MTAFTLQFHGVRGSLASPGVRHRRRRRQQLSCVDPTLRQLAAGADVLIYDAQYTPEEYPSRLRWGHSTFEAAAELARAAGVGTLVLFHHDPRRSDADVAALEARARERFASTVAAREGQRLEIAAGSLAEAA